MGFYETAQALKSGYTQNRRKLTMDETTQNYIGLSSRAETNFQEIHSEPTQILVDKFNTMEH